MPKSRSGFTLLKVPTVEGKEGPPPFEAPDKSVPYWLGKGCTKVEDDGAPEEPQKLSQSRKPKDESVIPDAPQS